VLNLVGGSVELVDWKSLIRCGKMLILVSRSVVSVSGRDESCELKCCST